VGTVADPRLNGHQVLTYGTREGDLFVWSVGGSAALNNSWWHYRHDEWNTGQYGLDTRPPAPVGGLKARRLRSGKVRLTFTAPGDDWNVGRAARYVISGLRFPKGVAARLPRPRPAGSRERLVVGISRRARFVDVRAVDAAGNIGTSVSVPIR
jgi:hypothetical protein